MNMFIVLIIPPNNNIEDMEIECAESKTNAENIINDYQRYKTYYDYKFKIIEKYVDIELFGLLIEEDE